MHYKDNLNLKYTVDHPQRILSTKEFPEYDIDGEVNLFKYTNIREAAAVSFGEWDSAKTSLLRYAASAEVAYTIYSVIYSLHKSSNSKMFDKTISLGLDVLATIKSMA